MDYSVLTQKELKQELKKLYKTDRALYQTVKREFLEPDVFLRIVIVIVVIFGAALLGVLTGCLIYSSEY